MANQYLDPYDASAGLAIWHQDQFDESTLKARAVDDILRKTGGLINKCILGLVAGVATAAVTADDGGAQGSMVPALVGMSTTLISYGLSRYQRSPEVKGLFHIVDASLSKELVRRVGVTQAIAEQIKGRSETALQELVAQNIYQGAYAYRASMAGTLLKQHLSPMNLIEFCRETLAMLRHRKSAEYFENYFGQRTQFEVNLAHLAALMGQSGDYPKEQVGFDHPSVRAFMKKAPDILPLFAKNKVHLESMLSALRVAIGPDASLVFGKESLDVNKVNQLLRPLLVECVVMAKRQAEIHNMSNLLLDIAMDVCKPSSSREEGVGWTPADAVKVASELQAMLHDKLIEHQARNISPAEPMRPFKYQGVLDACNTLISWVGHGAPVGGLNDDVLLRSHIGSLLFPKEKDRPYQLVDVGTPKVPQMTLKVKSIYDAYAAGMQDALKDALRKSVYVNDFFAEKSVAVDAIAARIMTKVFLIAHAEHHAEPSSVIDGLCGDTISEKELASAMSHVLHAPDRNWRAVASPASDADDRLVQSQALAKPRK